MPKIAALIEVFDEARALLARSDNNFAWSSWEDAADALEEIDAVLAALRAGTVPATIAMLFAPTGPIQEVSVSSGWGDEFSALADRIDRAMELCDCVVDAGLLAVIRELGMDSEFGEVSLLACNRCGQKFLRYFYEVEAFSHSGRWYLGAISEDLASSIRVEEARDEFAGMSSYRCGGSYYGGKVSSSSGPIVLNP